MDTDRIPSKKIIERIKAEQMVPDSKWKLNWKHYLNGVALAAAVLLGVMLFSLILLNSLDVGIGIAPYFRLRRFVWLLLLTAPYRWLAFWAISITLGVIMFRNTKRGYRYRTGTIIASLVVFVVVFGLLAHISRLNIRLNQLMRAGLPPYVQYVVIDDQQRFFRPELGLMMGRIKHVDEQIIILEKAPEIEWTIHIDPQTKIQRNLALHQGMPILIVGERINATSFRARSIRLLPIDKLPHQMLLQPLEKDARKLFKDGPYTSCEISNNASNSTKQ